MRHTTLQPLDDAEQRRHLVEDAGQMGRLRLDGAQRFGQARSGYSQQVSTKSPCANSATKSLA